MSGKKSKKLFRKKYIVLVTLAVVFIYSNLTAKEPAHEAKVSLLPDEKLLPALVQDINNAKKSIDIAIYMFKTNDKRRNDTELIKSALIMASRRGVKVYSAMESAKAKDFVTKANKDTGEELAAEGATVIYDSPKTRMHAKSVVIDGRIVYIGSHNYTHSALNYNRELTVRIESEEIAKQTIEYIKSIK
jgi:phosphatidylserine/phosphatidylglycerophosphate/cardiolipin synthase-like enzyme